MIYLQSNSKTMVNREKKKGKYLNILRTKKSFLDEIKSTFHNCLRGYRLVKK